MEPDEALADHILRALRRVSRAIEVHDVIFARAAEIDAALVVLSPHPARGLARLFGTRGDALIEALKRPTLVLPDDIVPCEPAPVETASTV